MRIRVTYDTPLFGNHNFWTGDHSQIDDIPNVTARLLAKTVVKDGFTTDTVCGPYPL